MKTRAAFYLRTSPLTRLARRLSRALRRPRRVARSPFTPVNIHQVKHDCTYSPSIEPSNNRNSKTTYDLIFAGTVGMSGLNRIELATLAAGRGGRVRGSVTRVAERLAGNAAPSPGSPAHAWLRLTPKDRMPQPLKVAFPKPPKAPGNCDVYVTFNLTFRSFGF